MKMWDSRPLTTVQASTASYGDILPISLFIPLL
jgi:hypothetical protein